MARFKLPKSPREKRKEELANAPAPVPDNTISPLNRGVGGATGTNARDTIESIFGVGVPTPKPTTPVRTTTALKGDEEQIITAQGVTTRGELRQANIDKQLAQIQAQEEAQMLRATAPQAVANIGTLTPEQQNRDVVIGEGIVGQGVTGAAAIGGAILGAKSGAAAGALLGPAGAAFGAVGGAIFGALGGAYVKVSQSKRQNVKEATAVYTQSKSNMVWIINQANAGTISPMRAVELWDEELANFYSAQRNINEEIDTNLNRFLSNGRDEAAKIEAFSRRLPELTLQLRQALANPNPSKVILEPNITNE